MNRNELQRVAELRVHDAELLLRNRRFEAAYYLIGYAVECAIKACIAKQTKEHDFPQKPDFVREVYTHNLTKLQTKMGVN